MSDPEAVFIFDPKVGALQRVVSVVEHLGYRALATSSTDEAPAMLEDEALAAMLVASCPEGVELCLYVGEFTSVDAPIAALLQDKEQRPPQEVVDEMNADAYLPSPCTTSALEAFLSAGRKLSRMREQQRELEHQLSDAEERLRQATGPGSSGFHQFDTVKDLLVVEVRRAKRYGYPLSVLMVGLDPLPAIHEMKRPSLQRDITAALSVAIAKSIRAIDLPIQYAADRILVFLPHTDLTGSEEVGRRIKRRIKRITYRGEGLTAQMTASVGLAGISVGDNLTFSKLIKDASAALRAAQLKGGDRVMKRVGGSS